MSSIMQILRRIGGAKMPPTSGSAGQLALWKAGTAAADATSLYAHDGAQWVELLDTSRNSRVITANDAVAGLRITQTGAGPALLVEDEANPDATPFVVTADGSVGVGVASPASNLAVVGAKAGFVSSTVSNTDTTAASIAQLAVISSAGATGALFARGNTDVAMGSVSNHPVKIQVNDVERFHFDTAGNALVIGSSKLGAGALGYGNNTGGTVMQGPNKTDGITINRRCGQITTGASALNAGQSVSFTVSNSLMTGDSLVILNNDNINYSVRVHSGAGGSFGISIKNEGAVSLSQQFIISFAIFKISLV